MKLFQNLRIIAFKDVDEMCNDVHCYREDIWHTKKQLNSFLFNQLMIYFLFKQIIQPHYIMNLSTFPNQLQITPLQITNYYLIRNEIPHDDVWILIYPYSKYSLNILKMSTTYLNIYIVTLIIIYNLCPHSTVYLPRVQFMYLEYS